jgi:hypothetical protein
MSKNKIAKTIEKITKVIINETIDLKKYTFSLKVEEKDKPKTKQKKYTKKERRNINLKHRYGINLDEFEEIIKEQNYECKCCGKDYTNDNKQEFVVDHKHLEDGERCEKKDIRGIICRNCNLMLGFSKDNPNNLNLGSIYLMKNGFNGIIKK